MAGNMMNSPIPFKGMVKKIVILNVGIWIILQILIGRFVFGDSTQIVNSLGLIPALVLTKGYIWQLLTYQFLHSMDITHIVFNMLLLWWIGAELEAKWGPKEFLKYYIGCGVGAGIVYTLGSLIWGLVSGSSFGLIVPVVGASGAIFGLLLAYGILFSERVIYFMMMFPMKAKHFVMLIGAVEVLWLLTGSQSGVANLAHLGGILSGYILLSYRARKSRKSGQSKQRKSGPPLRLVVDNEKKSDDGPKYWN